MVGCLTDYAMRIMHLHLIISIGLGFDSYYVLRMADGRNFDAS